MPVIQKRNVTVTVRLDEDTYSRLTGYAKRNWLTRSSAIHRILMDTLKQEKRYEESE